MLREVYGSPDENPISRIPVAGSQLRVGEFFHSAS
jgi:hypothetical protein